VGIGSFVLQTVGVVALMVGSSTGWERGDMPVWMSRGCMDLVELW
jgi:hypothetical protein